MPTLQRTKSQLARDIKRGAELRAKQRAQQPTNDRLKAQTKFLKFNKTITKKTNTLPARNTNFNKYANEMLIEKGWLKDGWRNVNGKIHTNRIPNINHPNFTNKILEIVRNKHRRNKKEDKAYIELNKNSIFIQSALTKIKSKLVDLKRVSTEQRKVNNSPPPYVPPATNGGGIRKNPATKTQKVLKDRHNQQKIIRARAAKLQAISNYDNKVVRNMIHGAIKKVVHGATPKTLPKNVKVLTGSTRCDILHCGQKASIKNPITLDTFKKAYIEKLPDTFTKMSTGDKRLFFCKEMGRNTQYCDRVYSLLK
jgi:hypothetical protein